MAMSARQVLCYLSQSQIVHVGNSHVAVLQDVAEAEGQVSPALLQRLILKPQKIQQLADGIRAIAAQEEPIRRVMQRMEVADGKHSLLKPNFKQFDRLNLHLHRQMRAARHLQRLGSRKHHES